MTRADLTDITFVLDRSGSMQCLKGPTIEAFNSFLASQRGGDGAAQLTLVQFDDQYELHYQAVPVAQAPLLTEATYQPRASTALLDAMGRTILATRQRLQRMAEHEKPGAVVFVTLTDGYENASHEFTLQQVNELIRTYRDGQGWQFLFLGANQDAIATAGQMGVGAGQAMTFAASPQGTHGVFGAFNGKLHRMRSARARGETECPVEFDTQDRREALGD